MFQLTKEESKIIWFQFETKYGKVEKRGGKFDKPYVFTEQGVAMLASFKDLGKKCFEISKIEDEDILDDLLNKLFK